MGKVKRSQFLTFLNTGASGTPEYSLMGNGITGQTVSYNPKTSDDTYIHEDSGTSDVESYKPTIATPQTAISGDPVFDYVDNLRKNRAVMDAARSDVIMVYVYEEATEGVYQAEKNTCSIQVDDYGGDGGGSLKINYTVNLIGDPIQGTFDPETKTFTAN